MMRKLYLRLLAGFALMAMVSCTEKIIDEVIEEPVPEVSTVKEATAIHVSVGAGFPKTKSTVDYNSTTGERTLKFTAGDRLHIKANIKNEYYLAGLLMVDESTIANGSEPATVEPATGAVSGTTAQFSGELKAYIYREGEGASPLEVNADAVKTATGVDLMAAADILAACQKADALLVPKALDDTDFIMDLSDNVVGGAEFYGAIAADADALMKSWLHVTGSYANGSFALSATSPILNVRLSGLSASTTYTVAYGISDSNYGDLRPANYGEVKTDGDGVVTLAIEGIYGFSGNHQLSLTNKAETYTIDLGTRTLATKVYNVTRRFVDLSNVRDDFNAQNGDILTGTLGGNYKLSIAAGATVTLAGMKHQAGQMIDGITCPGTANIILAAGTTNDLTRGNRYAYCGIGISGLGVTLTISGTGTLLASGGEQCPGIGSYVMGSIGNITINSGVQSLTVKNDAASPNSYFIGAGESSNCGTVTIDGTTSFSFTTSNTQFSHFNSVLSTTYKTNDTWTLTHK